MGHPRRDADFLLESLGSHRCGEFGTEHLQRYQAIVFQIPRQKHNGSGTAAGFPQQLVSSGQRSAESIRQGVYGIPPVPVDGLMDPGSSRCLNPFVPLSLLR